MGTHDYPLCDSCYDAHYTNCMRCNCLIPISDAYYEDDSDDPLCFACYRDRQNDEYLHDYSYKPEPIFYGDGNLFFGVELEIDDAGRDSENAEISTDLANRRRDHIYIKTDSSLDDGLRS